METKGLKFNHKNGVELGDPAAGGLCMDFECRGLSVPLGMRKDAALGIFEGDWEAVACVEKQHDAQVQELQWGLRLAELQQVKKQAAQGLKAWALCTRVEELQWDGCVDV